MAVAAPDERKMEHITKIVGNEVVKPLFRRVGTFAATYMVVAGVPKDTVETIVLGLIAGAGVIFDLTVSHFFRKKEKL